MLHIAQDKYGKSFEDCDSKERQSVGGTKVCCCAYIPNCCFYHSGPGRLQCNAAVVSFLWQPRCCLRRIAGVGMACVILV